MIAKIKKREGKIVDFDSKKIETSIYKAGLSIGKREPKFAKELSDEVVKILSLAYSKEIPSTENINETIKQVLEKKGEFELYKKFKEFCVEKREWKEKEKALGIANEKGFKTSIKGLEILKKELLKENEKPEDMLKRIAEEISKADEKHGKKVDIEKMKELFFNVMFEMKFLPSIQILKNIGTDFNQLSDNFSVSVDDSLPDIFDSLKDMSIIKHTGADTSISFSNIRPKGSSVSSTGKNAQGVLPFVLLFNNSAEIISKASSGKSRTSAVLKIEHPDIEQFSLLPEKEFSEDFSLSVSISDKFMDLNERAKEYELVNPRTGKPEKKITTSKMMINLSSSILKYGGPDIIFIDSINKKNTLSEIGDIESASTKGSQALLSDECCVSGSINLSKFVKEKDIDWEELKKTVWLAVHMLDNCIDVSAYPLEKSEKLAKLNRKIALGVMGFADMLINLGIKYDSQPALLAAEKIMSFIAKSARVASAELAELKGEFPNCKKSKLPSSFRNSALLSVSSDEKLSTLAGCENGISSIRKIVKIESTEDGKKFAVVNLLFVNMSKKEGFYSDGLMDMVIDSYSIQNIKAVPEHIKRLFITAEGISPENQLKMIFAFQKYTDGLVSMPIIIKKDAKQNEIEDIIRQAHNLGIKILSIRKER